MNRKNIYDHRFHGNVLSMVYFELVDKESIINGKETSRFEIIFSLLVSTLLVGTPRIGDKTAL